MHTQQGVPPAGPKELPSSWKCHLHKVSSTLGTPAYLQVGSGATVDGDGHYSEVAALSRFLPPLNSGLSPGLLCLVLAFPVTSPCSDPRHDLATFLVVGCGLRGPHLLV